MASYRIAIILTGGTDTLRRATEREIIDNASAIADRRLDGG